MDVNQVLLLLGGISPREFMRHHWQRKPMLVRQALPGMAPLMNRAALIELASRDGVESRLVMHGAQGAGTSHWRLRHGPFARRSLPPLKQPQWSLLVQGVDLHDQAAHALLKQFRFVPDARLDDLMISYATDGGGVGPHFDSYDVFLLQMHGRRRWRFGRQRDLSLQEGVPLKILQNFETQQDHVLEPGDMLYLPPGYAHDGVAMGECMTCSIGFRAPSSAELAGELLQRIAEEAPDELGDARYRDPRQAAVDQPGEIPQALLGFAREAVHCALQDGRLLETVLGEYLTEPKPGVWFGDAAHGRSRKRAAGLRLDRRTRMMFDERNVYINGESYRASGRDARLMRQLANARELPAAQRQRASAQAQLLLDGWIQAGWMHEYR